MPLDDHIGFLLKKESTSIIRSATVSKPLPRYTSRPESFVPYAPKAEGPTEQRGFKRAGPPKRPPRPPSHLCLGEYEIDERGFRKYPHGFTPNRSAISTNGHNNAYNNVYNNAYNIRYNNSHNSRHHNSPRQGVSQRHGALNSNSNVSGRHGAPKGTRLSGRVNDITTVRQLTQSAADGTVHTATMQCSNASNVIPCDQHDWYFSKPRANPERRFAILGSHNARLKLMPQAQGKEINMLNTFEGFRAPPSPSARPSFTTNLSTVSCTSLETATAAPRLNNGSFVSTTSPFLDHTYPPVGHLPSQPENEQGKKPIHKSSYFFLAPILQNWNPNTTESAAHTVINRCAPGVNCGWPANSPANSPANLHAAANGPSNVATSRSSHVATGRSSNCTTWLDSSYGREVFNSEDGSSQSSGENIRGIITFGDDLGTLMSTPRRSRAYHPTSYSRVKGNNYCLSPSTTHTNVSHSTAHTIRNLQSQPNKRR